MEQWTELRTRRHFLRTSTALGLGATMALSLGELLACAPPPEDRRLGVALAGLGNYSTNKLGPALRETRFCRLAGIVTGTPAKAEQWMKNYGIPKKNVYSYDTFDRLADNPDIDVVYVVLPNAMHAEFTIRAARAGKHVICEKPMANTPEECRQMIAACEKAGVKLQIGYRCQYDPSHREVMRLGQEEALGPVRLFESGNAFFLGDPNDNWRFTDRSLAGGGALMDMGVYCIQGARYTMGREPVAVSARAFTPRPALFREGLEETMLFQLEFPGGAVANCSTSYGARADYLRVSADQGNFELHPCYQYNQPQGEAAGEAFAFPASNQQAVQMDAFARNILDDTPVVAGGEEGLRDMLVVEALYRSAAAGGIRTEVRGG